MRWKGTNINNQKAVKKNTDIVAGSDAFSAMKQLMEKPEEYVDMFHSLMDKQMKIESDVVECCLKAENELAEQKMKNEKWAKNLMVIMIFQNGTISH
jgi:hypothetical protein